MSDWVGLLVTVALGVAGLSVFFRARQETAARVAEGRLEAYTALWKAMSPAQPMAGVIGMPYPDASARRTLFDALTVWYFDQGHGLMLSSRTRALYLTAKKNLVCDVVAFQPESSRAALAALAPTQLDAERGRLSVRQLSLVRTAMRADLAIFAKPWGSKLGDEDRAFLRACGLSPWRRPWRPPLSGTPSALNESEDEMPAVPAVPVP